jgi:DUF438 domain-containing protein
MNEQKILCFLVDDLKDPIVLVDTGHVIRYINKSARQRYQRFGDILGKSIFECHNETSCDAINKAFNKLKEGEQEVLISSNEKRRLFMRAVYDENKKLSGYYERYEFLKKAD